MTELDVSSSGAYPRGYHNHGAPTFYMVVPDEDVEDPRPSSHVPISQFFSEGNGGEFRYFLQSNHKTFPMSFIHVSYTLGNHSMVILVEWLN